MFNPQWAGSWKGLPQADDFHEVEAQGGGGLVFADDFEHEFVLALAEREGAEGETWHFSSCAL